MHKFTAPVPDHEYPFRVEGATLKRLICWRASSGSDGDLRVSAVVNDDQGVIVREYPAVIVLPTDWAIDQIDHKLEESKVATDRLLDDVLGEPLAVPISLIPIEPGTESQHD
jgi:hypothetical protein